MSTWMAHHGRPIDYEEQKLYDHLLELVQSELPSQLIDRIHRLFIDGVGYPDAEISAALDRIAAAKDAEQEFRFVLNRCCHILINRWQTRPQYHSAISELVSAFTAEPSQSKSELYRSRSVRRVRSLVQEFVGSEQYLALQRLACVVDQSPKALSNSEKAPLGSLIHRYPYLYEHCLLVEGSPREHQQAIRQLQARAQRQYEIDLSQYVTYQVRRTKLAQAPAQSVNRILQPVENPTLLSDRELCLALKQFVGKSQGNATYQDVAQRFLSHTQPQSFRGFKDDLYQYITASIDSEYGSRQFNKQLYHQLCNTLPDSNSQALNDFLMVRTCSQLLNFLVVESPHKPQHFVLIDLISNLGPTLTTGLLLKIVLLCRKIKPYLEKRFSILFNHYESFSREAVQWLIQVMENLNLALSVNFSTVDLSFINQIA